MVVDALCAGKIGVIVEGENITKAFPTSIVRSYHYEGLAEGEQMNYTRFFAFIELKDLPKPHYFSY